MQINTLSADDRRALGLERSGADIEAVVRGYIEAQLWTTQDESLDNGTLTNDGAMMDARLSFDDVYENYRDAVREELGHYIADHPLAYRLYCAQRAHDLTDAEEIGGSFGHDFFLTREHHGAGFWDRDYRRSDGTLDDAIGEFWTSVAQSAGGAEHIDGHVPARPAAECDGEPVTLSTFDVDMAPVRVTVSADRKSFQVIGDGFRETPKLSPSVQREVAAWVAAWRGHQGPDEQESAATGALEGMLERVSPFVRSAVLNDRRTHVVITTDDDIEWTLEVNDPDPSTYGTVSLWHDMRAVSFTGWDELRGWLRCYRSMKS